MRIGSAPGDQAVPRECRHLAGDDGLERIGETLERLRKLVLSRWIMLHPREEERQHVHQPADAGVRCKGTQQGLRSNQALHRLRDFIRRFE